MISISELCGVNSSKANATANFILYQLLDLHRKVFKDGLNYLWQPVSFASEEHKLNCLAISHYLNGDLRAAKKAWKGVIKLNPFNVHALYNLAIQSPFTAEHYLE